MKIYTNKEYKTIKKYDLHFSIVKFIEAVTKYYIVLMKI